MKFLFLLALSFQGLILFAQPKWASSEPTSESRQYYYFNGVGETKELALFDALVAMAYRLDSISVSAKVELKRQVTETGSNTVFDREEGIQVGNKSYFVFPVRYEQINDLHYIMIGSPKNGRSSDGGVMKKSQFLWRSSLVPGWGQFYNKEPTKGLFFSIGTVALISGTVLSFGSAAQQGDQAELSLLQGNLAQYNTYHQNEKTLRITGTILGAGAVAMWVLNIVDATASEKNLYVFERHDASLNLMASVGQVGLKLQF